MSSVPSISTDTSSAAYKKAKKQYLKTTKARNKDVELDWTPFRAAEKKYKAHFPPPDLSQVLDLATLDASRAEEIKLGGWCGSSNVVDYREIRLNHNGDRKAYSIPSIPGLVVLPSFLSPDDQRHLIQWSLTGQARNPNPTNLDAHYLLPDEGLWNAYAKSRKGDFLDETVQPRTFSSTENTPEPPGPRKLIANQSVSPSNFHTVSSSPKTPPTPSTTLTSAPCSALIRKLRWANIGWYYHWGTKQYDFTRGKADINPEIRNVCKKAVESINWEDVFGVSSDLTWGEDGPDWRNWTNSYEPDAGIVNFYQTKDTLMAHVDRSEVCTTSPLVSISLGNAAIFLIGGLTRDTEPTPILLRSGDAVIMSGPLCRRAYHGVPRVLDNTLPKYLQYHEEDSEWKEYSDYLRTTRININVRQVFPKGFDPLRQP